MAYSLNVLEDPGEAAMGQLSTSLRKWSDDYHFIISFLPHKLSGNWLIPLVHLYFDKLYMLSFQLVICSAGVE